MKRLLLLRHGKSDWDAAYGADIERPLSNRGTTSAEAIGRFVAQTGQVPDAVVSSPAVRARRTAELAIEAGQWQRSVSLDDDLYGASAGMALSVIQSAPDSAESLLVAGHEPTTSQLVRLLTEAHVQVRTATLVAIDLPHTNWRSTSPGFGALAWMINPRLLTDGTLDLG
jgi:phosphohistidine phosphatase